MNALMLCSRGRKTALAKVIAEDAGYVIVGGIAWVFDPGDGLVMCCHGHTPDPACHTIDVTGSYDPEDYLNDKTTYLTRLKSRLNITAQYVASQEIAYCITGWAGYAPQLSKIFSDVGVELIQPLLKWKPDEIAAECSSRGISATPYIAWGIEHGDAF